MSGFGYDPTAEEDEAAALLRAKGWEVKPPRCPDCHGFGGKVTFSTWTSGGAAAISNVSTGTWQSCPRGCSMPGWYYPIGVVGAPSLT